MSKHIHADLMKQYTEDAQTTDKPWELWEVFNGDNNEWINLREHPLWSTLVKYRRKQHPTTVTYKCFEHLLGELVWVREGSATYNTVIRGSYTPVPQLDYTVSLEPESN